MGAHRRWNPRAWRPVVIGGVVGGVIPTIPVAIGQLDSDWTIVSMGGIIGVFVGAFLGACFGSRVRQTSTRGAFGLALGMAVLAVLLGDALVGLYIAFGLASESDISGAFLWLMAVGLIVIGIPALMLTVPSAIAWVIVMRWLPVRWFRG